MNLLEGPQLAGNEKCTGCFACANACPLNCIEMVLAEDGFVYPTVETNSCINCGICSQVCPVLEKSVSFSLLGQSRVYAGWHIDPDVRYRSSSGGLFTAFAESVLRERGFVYGAKMSGNLSIEHGEISKLEDLPAFCGSKYLQSSLPDTYQQVKKRISSGQHVLFSGTPCQVAGLKQFIGRDYENLKTCDLVCHGVPSLKVFNVYRDYVEQTTKKKLKFIEFRNKRTGWIDFSLMLSFHDGSHFVRSFREDIFMRVFLSDLALRESCYSCRYKACGDVTLGDFWGISKLAPELFDNQGVSLLLVNSEKGQQLLESIANNIFVSPMTLESACRYNPCVVSPVKRPVKRDEFMRELGEIPFKKLLKKYDFLEKGFVEKAKSKGKMIWAKVGQKFSRIFV